MLLTCQTLEPSVFSTST